MSTPTAGPLARHLRRLLPPAGLAALTDGQLLERFAAVRDEADFAALPANPVNSHRSPGR